MSRDGKHNKITYMVVHSAMEVSGGNSNSNKEANYGKTYDSSNDRSEEKQLDGCCN